MDKTSFMKGSLEYLSHFAKRSLKIQVAKLYRTIAKVLTPRERTVIIKRYGLDGGEALPQREIAAALGISRSYVSRIEKKALEKLRSGLEEGQS